MTFTGFQLDRLTLTGRGVPSAEVRFRAGLNVVSGPSDTGKTFIIQCIDFMLGASTTPKSIPEAERYDTVRLGIKVNGDARTVELERSLRGGEFKLRIEGQADRVLGAKHTAGDKSSLSHYLLSLTGLASKKVRTNAQGKTRDLSFRDLARLILVDEEDVIAEKSPIRTGQFTSATVESAVFRLLLTGVDDGSVVAGDDPKVARGRQAGKAEMLELLLKSTQGRLSELQLPGDEQAWRDHLLTIEAQAEEAEKVLAAEQQSAAALEERRRAAWAMLRRSESRSAVLTELQQRFALLHEQYASDLRRLEIIAEAGTRLGQMSEERCPVCGAPSEHQEHEHRQTEANPVDVAQACRAEAAKISALIRDLDATRIENAERIQVLMAEIVEAKRDLKSAGEELQDRLKPRVEVALQTFRDSQSQRDAYRRAMELLGRVNEFQGLLSEIRGDAVTASASLPSAKVRTDEAEGFSAEAEALLKRWRFPNLGRVTFSDGDQDLVISGRQRASHGKGVRAIAHAAFNLALLSYCVKQDRPHPGVVLIDSPLVVYREPDVGEGSFSREVKDSFYMSLNEDFKNLQIVIFENEDPPSDIAGGANVIRFTGAQHGRPGFIPID
jgi:hypothetical protein